MDCSTPVSPVLHYLPEFAQIHVHWVSDATQLSYFPPPSFPFAFNLSQHQGLFQWVGSSYQVTKVLELQLQPQLQPFLWIQGWFPLGLTCLIETSPAPWFGSISSSVLKLLSGPTLTHPFLTPGETIALTRHTLKSLLFNMLSRFVIAFLPRNKRLLIPWL